MGNIAEGEEQNNKTTEEDTKETDETNVDDTEGQTDMQAELFDAKLEAKLLRAGVREDKLDAAKTEYIIYDHDTLGIASTVEGLRLVEDDKTFVGSFAQIMSIMGGIVANPALAIAKVTASN